MASAQSTTEHPQNHGDGDGSQAEQEFIQNEFFDQPQRQHSFQHFGHQRGQWQGSTSPTVRGATKTEETFEQYTQSANCGKHQTPIRKWGY